MNTVTDTDERIGKCRKILDTDPNSQIFAALAEAHRRKGELDKAFRICQNGLRIHPSYGSAHVVMAKINLDRGLFDWAEAEVKKAIEVGGTNRAVELLLAEVNISRGEFTTAVRMLKIMYQADPESAQIKKLLEISMKLQQEQVTAKKTIVRGVSENTVIERESVSVVAEREPESIDGCSLLRRSVEIPDMRGALMINSEGLVIESEWGPDMDAAICGAVLAEVSSSLNQELVKVSFGRVDTILIETGQYVFYLFQAVNGMFLFVGDADLNLGAMRMKIAGLLRKYKPS